MSWLFCSPNWWYISSNCRNYWWGIITNRIFTSTDLPSFRCLILLSDGSIVRIISQGMKGSTDNVLPLNFNSTCARSSITCWNVRPKWVLFSWFHRQESLEGLIRSKTSGAVESSRESSLLSPSMNLSSQASKQMNHVKRIPGNIILRNMGCWDATNCNFPFFFE